MLRVSVAGASGFVGGELLRLLSSHPGVQLAQVTSQRRAGQFVHQWHPVLRGRSDLRFTSIEELESCDLLFLALPHGQASQRIEELARIAPRIIDCSADFRLEDPAAYERYYGEEHPAPEWLERFVYGLPEVNREALREASFASGVGCNATAINLALLPLARAGVIDTERDLVIELKVGSSEGGDAASSSGHHPHRSGVVRSYAPVGHRHMAEAEQVLGLERMHMSVTAVEMVRGALATGHVFLRDQLTEKDLWRIYRETWGAEPFVRVVHGRTGNYRHPEPKILAGSNHADVGWALDETSGRVVALCAIDNLMKGAAGTALQCMNLMCGLDEAVGLEFPGLCPV